MNGFLLLVTHPVGDNPARLFATYKQACAYLQGLLVKDLLSIDEAYRDLSPSGGSVGPQRIAVIEYRDGIPVKETVLWRGP